MRRPSSRLRAASTEAGLTRQRCEAAFLACRGLSCRVRTGADRQDFGVDRGERAGTALAWEVLLHRRAPPGRAAMSNTTIDFEDLPDGTVVEKQYQNRGLTFVTPPQ